MTTPRPPVALVAATGLKQGLGKPDELAQCLEFAQWAKHKNIRGRSAVAFSRFVCVCIFSFLFMISISNI